MLNNTVAVPRRSVLSDEIYLLIRKMIFNYEILPGAKVNIDALAKKLDVSQTPVRQALSRLESDGLIVKEPLKGFRATDLLTIQQLDDLFKFRLLIEPFAAAEAAKKIDETGRKALKSEIESAKNAIKISGDALRAFLFHVESSFAGMSLTYAAVSPKTPIAKTKKNASTMLTMTFQSV